MIEVNLKVGEKDFRLPVILGLDLNIISIKGIIIALFVHFIVPPIFNDNFLKGLEDIDTKIRGLKRQIRELKKKKKSQQDIQDQIDSFLQKEKKLNNKLVVVKRIIKLKKNPLKILLYISKNIPEDLWLTSMSLENDNIALSGESNSYKSIGRFIENLKKATFFDQSLKLTKSQTRADDSGRRVEEFEIKAKIVSYE